MLDFCKNLWVGRQSSLFAFIFSFLALLFKRAVCPPSFNVIIGWLRWEGCDFDTILRYIVNFKSTLSWR